MIEIKINYDELNFAILGLKVLEEGTGYSIYSTADFLNHSRGKMFNSTNEMYAKLMEIENVLIETIKRTNKALNNAGVSFEVTENELISVYKNK